MRKISNKIKDMKSKGKITEHRDIVTLEKQILENYQDIYKSLKPLLEKQKEELHRKIFKEKIEMTLYLTKSGRSDNNHENRIQLANQKFMEMIQIIIESTSPIIYELSKDIIEPRNEIDISGVNFGTEKGTIGLEINDGEYFELEINQWNENYVKAFLPNDCIGYNPYSSARILLFREDSRYHEFPIMFQPLYGLWIGYVIKSLEQCAIGTQDGIICNHEYLDTFFEIVSVFKRHFGNTYSHSELTSPHAAGQSLAQGYHIGSPYLQCLFNRPYIFVTYNIIGPAGISPSNTPDDLGHWYLLTHNDSPYYFSYGQHPTAFNDMSTL